MAPLFLFCARPSEGLIVLESLDLDPRSSSDLAVYSGNSIGITPLHVLLGSPQYSRLCFFFFFHLLFIYLFIYLFILILFLSSSFFSQNS